MIIFENANLLLPERDELAEGGAILIEGDRIREVSVDGRGITSAGAERIDCGGMTVMPGLIDCHVHVASGDVSLNRNALLPDSLVAARAVRALESTLRRGFTTIRDCGGGDLGLVKALEEGTIDGPRLVICGQALSQSGGHTDFRDAFDERDPAYYKRRLGAAGRICDGEAEVRKAAREEIKAGAQFIKIMANGGVASLNDPIHFLQFSRNEISAIVEEAANAGLYVAAHLYTDEAIRRAVELGVRSVEHCNLVSPETAAIMKEKAAIAVPTLIVLHAYADQGPSLGMADLAMRKAAIVCEAAFTALERLSAAGVDMAFGTDLTVTEMMPRQPEEFRLRSRVLKPRDVIASATTTAAKLLRMEGQIGELSPGAYADLIAVRGNPLKDIEVLADLPGSLALVMKSGRPVDRRLDAKL
jgi:imidazolonepropionase-like amidohydrolase